MSLFALYALVRPLLFRVEAEKSHHLALALIKAGVAPRYVNDADPLLHTRVCNLDFPNPIGLAAGFDKQAEIMRPMFGFGFGAVELGSITPLPQPGNPRPRLFRDAGSVSIINRFGFNSDGFDACLKRIGAYCNTARKPGVLGINIGKNKASTDAAHDYTEGIRLFAPYADYLTINISSPNTPGLRDLQTRAQLQALLQQCTGARNAAVKKPPLFVKVAPDQTDAQMEDIAEVTLASGIDGIIIGNTTITRPDDLPASYAREGGGLSGKPLLALSTAKLAQMYRLTQGKLPLIGCGGVASGVDAYAKIRAGASLVQLYSALIFEGPTLVPRINRELAALLQRDGFTSLRDAVGTGAGR